MRRRCQRDIQLAAFEQTERDFLRRYPDYAGTSAIDELRAVDYSRLDRLGHVYLDHTGGGQFGESQLRRHHDLLCGTVLGNPHSHNPTSLAATQLVQEARDAVLAFFNADEEEYEVVFTANASGALKLVGEAYPFRPGSVYLLSYDNHNSVNGIRVYARSRGAAVTYVPVRKKDLRLDEEQLQLALRGIVSPGCRVASRSAADAGDGRCRVTDDRDAPSADRCRDHLFAYPAQSNFSGVQHPLEWIAQAQDLGWDVLLDCAAFAPTNPLDLSAIHPDFVPVSFYKLFGYPTGVGALIARREKLAKLRRPWFAGGTITLASVQEEGWYQLAPGAQGFEDGTLDYLGLPAVTIGLERLIAVGMATVHSRVCCLAGWLLEELGALRHSNGAPLVSILGPADVERRGATVALLLLDPGGRPYDVYDVETAAGERLISIRTGCFCNPGDGEVAHDLGHADMERCFRDRRAVISLLQCQQVIEDATGKLPNTIRVSLGLVSDFSDVYRFLEFAAGYRDRVR